MVWVMLMVGESFAVVVGANSKINTAISGTTVLGNFNQPSHFFSINLFT
jgi:hypothetical protein